MKTASAVDAMTRKAAGRSLSRIVIDILPDVFAFLYARF
jgi:hypothetical protein